MAPTPYTLYYANDSLFSFMLRHTLADRGPGKDGIQIAVEEELMDIHDKREQLSEFFLCDVNPKGMVPAITSPALEEPMSDSLKITHYLATMFPSLMPASHRGQIVELLDEMHGLPCFTLSFGNHPAIQAPEGTAKRIREMLDGDNLSDRHRATLQAGWDVVRQMDMSALLSPEAIQNAETKMREFLGRVSRYLPEAGTRSGPWLFGLKQASALDAHLVALLVRLQDVGRGGLLPERLDEYAAKAKQTDAWRSVMHGLRTTMDLG